MVMTWGATSSNYPTINAACCLPQDFLRGAGTLEHLATKYAITSKRHKEFPNLVQLKYSQIDSPMQEKIVQQCRGLILNEDNNWSIVAWPIDKFFNHGEPEAHPINWTQAVVQEKLDGSLIIMYWYDGKWRAATSGTPDASGSVNGTGWTFNQLFWSVFTEKGYKTPSPLQRAYTYMFELMTPYNRVVVRHVGCDLRLLATKNLWTGREIPAKYTMLYEGVREFPLKTLPDILETFREMDPLVQEGYVIYDGINRVKVKHPRYVMIHHLRDNMGPQRILDVVRQGESAEPLASFPEWTDAFEQVQAAYDGLRLHVEAEWDRLKNYPNEDRFDQTAFAIEAVKCPCSGILFSLRKAEISSVSEGLKEMRLDALGDILGVMDMKLEGV